MTDYMPKVGTLGLDMMYRTCTVQTNLDYASEADMVKKLRVSLALQPVGTALFRQFAFTEGKPNGFLSFRSEIWRHTDPDRSGMLPWAFESGMGFERGSITPSTCRCISSNAAKNISTWRAVVPRSTRRQAARSAGRARHHLGLVEPRLDDLSRGPPQALSRDAAGRTAADGGACRRCRPSGSACFTTTPASTPPGHRQGLTVDERQKLRDDVPKLDCAQPYADGACAILATQCLAIAREGLKRATGSTPKAATKPDTRAARRSGGAGVTPAEELLEGFHGPWGGSVAPDLHRVCVLAISRSAGSGG